MEVEFGRRCNRKYIQQGLPFLSEKHVDNLEEFEGLFVCQLF
jgi:hypothetical protein